ncbi:MAG: BrnT family toxin [Bacteroidetes bacterium]|nr:MAG: BrnT family toxin [Bacteroidota bacterium]RLD94507.1 MAG: BrnT family toxin [Bacteroidota bacterium]
MFEFDPNKSEANKLKHGIDFYMARKLWIDPKRVEIPAKWVDESRFLIIACLEKDIWSAIYTVRNKRIRIISVRKARDNEKEIYHSSRV